MFLTDRPAAAGLGPYLDSCRASRAPELPGTEQHNAAFRGNRLCAQQIRAVDKLTALRRVYDFIDLRQRLASMETALLAPEPRRGTSGFVLLDLGKAHLYSSNGTAVIYSCNTLIQGTLHRGTRGSWERGLQSEDSIGGHGHFGRM
ncbi:uncharacterized protein LOC121111016 isoform X5 [Gallus gallus]|uniref:uncharacterized protein LOC121111016 isoform X5 n=1 Tax=Gallus gallus TaxID=9031 RepID=UPI001F01CD2D|nr:uncharacterized protein LOC121111016 isoform X5 [Gallus gallus]